MSRHNTIHKNIILAESIGIKHYLYKKFVKKKKKSILFWKIVKCLANFINLYSELRVNEHLSPSVSFRVRRVEKRNDSLLKSCGECVQCDVGRKHRPDRTGRIVKRRLFLISVGRASPSVTCLFIYCRRACKQLKTGQFIREHRCIGKNHRCVL